MLFNHEKKRTKLIRGSLYPLSLVYQFLVSIRNNLYESGFLPVYRLPGECISVGNLTVGGTGKTPLTIEIAQHLEAMDKKPIILSRGYKSGLQKGCFALYKQGKLIATNDPRGFSHIKADEAQMQSVILKKVPVLISNDRYGASQWYHSQNLSYKPTHWILDDGFQHRKIYRDFDILLINGYQSLAQEKLLPRGILREGIQSMKRAQIIVHSRPEGPYYKENHKLCSKALGKQQKIISSQVKIMWPCQPEKSEKKLLREGPPVLLVCGIANPQLFFQDITNLGITIANKVIFQDHESICSDKILKIIEKNQPILTTEKDYWRDPSIFKSFKQPVFISKIRASIDLSFLNHKHS